MKQLIAFTFYLKLLKGIIKRILSEKGKKNKDIMKKTNFIAAVMLLWSLSTVAQKSNPRQNHRLTLHHMGYFD